MKAKIHPDYHKITIVMTDGEKYETRSTWGKEGDVMTLDVDSKTHPAWVGGVNLRKTGQMEKFTNKFSAYANFGAKDAKVSAEKPTKKAKPEGEAAAKPKKEAKAPKAEAKAETAEAPAAPEAVKEE